MTKSEETRLHLLKTASTLFNTKGYNSTSLSDITFASGFTKGAIYKHFDNKSNLEIEALRHMCNTIMLYLRDKIKAEDNAIDKLKAVFQYYIKHVTDPIFTGGCPVLNASVEVDDTQPSMKQVLIYVMKTFHETVVTILENGIRFGQLKPKIKTAETATMIITSLEGAIMMSKLTDDTQYLKQVNAYLLDVVKGFEK